MDNSKASYKGWAIVAVLTAICLLIPEQGLYTHQVKLFLAVTVFGLALAAFELVPTMYISIMMPTLWIILGVAPASVVLSPWTGTVVLLLGGALFLAATLEDSGLLKRISFYLMCKVKGNYFVLLLSMFFIGVLLNIFTSGNGNVVLAPLALGLCIALHGMGNNFGAGLAAAVMLGTCQSHVYTYYPVGWGVMFQLGQGYVSPLDVTPLSLLLYTWPLLIVSIITLWVASKMFKPDIGFDLSNVTYFKDELDAMGPLTKREKTNAVMLILLLVLLFTVNIHKMDLNLILAFIPWLVYLPGLDGATKDTVKKADFTVIFFVMTCMAIGTVANNIGLGAALGELVLKVLALVAGNPFAVVAFIFGVTFLMNFAMTPMAIFAMLIVPLCAAASEIGLDPVPLLLTLNCSVEAIIFPYEYTPYLVVFGFGMMTMKDFIKFSAVRSGLFFIGMMVLLVPYWLLIGLI